MPPSTSDGNQRLREQLRFYRWIATAAHMAMMPSLALGSNGPSESALGKTSIFGRLQCYPTYSGKDEKRTTMLLDPGQNLSAISILQFQLLEERAA